MKATDEQITEAIRAAEGNCAAAARAVGLSRGRLHARLQRDPRLWPAGVPRPLRTLSAEVITAALRLAEGSINDAARSLGVADDVIRARLDEAADLWPSDVPRPCGRGRTLRPSDNDRTRAAIAAAGGDLRVAAEALGIKLPTLRARVFRDPTLRVPSKASQERSDSQGARRERRAREIALLVATTRSAIREAEGNMASAAALLGITREAVRQRVEAHPDAWPEGVPQEAQTRRAAVARERAIAIAAERATRAEAAAADRRARAERIRAALRAARGNVTHAAVALDLHPSDLFSRLRRWPDLWPAELPPRRKTDR